MPLNIYERPATKDSLSEIRQKAWDRVQAMGFPPLPELSHSCATHSPETVPGPTLFFCNGRLDLHRSTFPISWLCMPLERAMQSHGPFLQQRLTHALKEETDPVALLHLALHQEGAFLYIPPHETATLHLHFSATRSGWSAPRLQLFLGRNTHITLFQTNGVPSLSALDCLLEETASLKVYHHTKNIEFHSLRAALKKGSQLTTFHCATHSSASRHSLKIELLEEGASATLKGLTLPQARCAATSVRIEHKAPHCHSHQHFKALLGMDGISHFEGNIFVHSIAQKTTAYQLNQNFLLHDSAVASTKPNLEIFADDVKASHGATLSTFQPEELFYLQTRGLSVEAAKQLLVHAFCQELLAPLPSTAWKQELEAALQEV